MAAMAQLLTGRSTAAAAAEALAGAAAAGTAAAGESAGTPLDKAADAAGAQQSAGARASQPGGAPDRVQQLAGSAVCLSGLAKGRAVLLRVGRQWQLLEQSLREAPKRDVLPSAAAAMPLPPPLLVSGTPLTHGTLCCLAGVCILACSPATLHGSAVLKLTQWQGRQGSPSCNTNESSCCNSPLTQSLHREHNPEGRGVPFRNGMPFVHRCPSCVQQPPPRRFRHDPSRAAGVGRVGSGGP